MRYLNANKIFTDEVMARVRDKVGRFIRDEAKRKCPTDNGMLRNSLQYKVEGDIVTVFSDLPYANYVEYGTGIYHINEEGGSEPHLEWDIVPVNGKALKFETGRKGRLASGKGPGSANIVFAKKVHQVGMQAHPFLRPAYHQNIGKIKKIIASEAAK